MLRSALIVRRAVVFTTPITRYPPRLATPLATIGSLRTFYRPHNSSPSKKSLSPQYKAEKRHRKDVARLKGRAAAELAIAKKLERANTAVDREKDNNDATGDANDEERTELPSPSLLPSIGDQRSAPLLSSEAIELNSAPQNTHNNGDADVSVASDVISPNRIDTTHRPLTPTKTKKRSSAPTSGSSPPTTTADESIGTLVLAATPIGNLGDITDRLLTALRTADAVYCEDTRRTQILMLTAKAESKGMLHTYNAMSGPGIRQQISERLRSGETVVYVSDAGTPGIADPGAELINLAYSIDAKVDVLPGPSAVTTAVVLSGLTAQSMSGEFAFLGWFARTPLLRERLMKRLTALQLLSVFFESPHRILYTLDFLSLWLPTDLSIVVCRELTKRNQRLYKGTPHQIIDIITAGGSGDASNVSLKGEFVLVIPPIQHNSGISLGERFKRLMTNDGMSRGQAIKELSQRSGIDKRRLTELINAELASSPPEPISATATAAAAAAASTTINQHK